ncbi:MAG: hemerythrin domain-containing protein [Patescibacteria group bacterium]
MKATKMLQDEHRVIERFLHVLAKLADRAEKGRIEEEKFSQVLDFIQTFADRCHHGKEEDVLYPLLEKKGIPKVGGPIGMMLFEHEEGRGYVAGLTKAIEGYRSGKNTKEEIIENARGYIGILENHIPKEDNILYPMGEQVLSPQDDSNLISEFEKIEKERIVPGKHEEYHRLIERLEKEIKND